ncbi:MAG: pseudouridine synthase [Alphaproteobacteria bacterium]|nr:pseudouridine synthase [Alphaproteobacteria bacterium]MBO4643516.1 pseudouridine synthase [Alphaproteobacteria bacterium]
MLQYIAFYKPYGVLSQFTAEGGHEGLGGFDLPSGVYAAGRLDHDSEGLLLLTNDGKLIKKLLDPDFAHPRSYLAQLDGDVTEQALERLRQGVKIKGYQTKPCLAEKIAEPPDLPERIPPIRFRKNIPTSWIKLTLTEGKNRQVRHMTAAVGFPTLRLIRVSIGKLTLSGMRPGRWIKIEKRDIL